MWRPATRQITGTNDVPLGNRRRFGPAPAEEAAPPQLAQPSPSAYPRQQADSPGKRDRDESPANDPRANANAPRKRRSRWGDSSTEIPGLPTAISATGVSQTQLDNYAIHLRLEEINRKLRLNDYIPPERERSPSPPPTYDAQGRRSNTREVRYRKKLEDERIRLVDKAMKNDPNFRPPVEYHQQKRSQRPSERVYIPVKEFPEINFFGLLVGPRGNSLKKMERESGAKISIRGKGSVKEGKTRPDQYADDAEEDLHCLVMAETPEKVVACVKMINRVIETAASTPEGQNDHKRNQLRELAALNGTLRDDENQICKNCGGVGHRQYDCPEQKNFTANIVCRVCGSAGHMARDCTQNKDANGNSYGAGNGTGPNGRVFDSEYANLMAELGETPAAGAAGAAPVQTWSSQTDLGGGGANIPPWRRPENWQTTNQPQNNGYRPPQAGYGAYGQGAAWAGFNQGYGGQQEQQDYNYASYYQAQ
ncbi:Splicing factor SF1 [Mycena indigotica]|uniref:Branchpoint-bridging protein n=1 Tax=Mycena indigotica TaxID=2126181 RepID=A0A8H6T739_9AGAR|nr:Splicing factor SF1 [Mycena indigotica]KAF7312120.1 Splicing factor SF1 [Mycena indigotica]